MTARWRSKQRVETTEPSATPAPARWHDGVPGSFLAALALAAGFMAFTAWDQSHWWRVKEDYSFGWLVPLFTLYVVFDRWAELVARLQAAAQPPVAPRWVRWTLNGAAALGLTGGALFFLLGSFYRAGAGTSQPGTFAITTGMAAIVLSLLFFNVPVAAVAGPATGVAERNGPGALGREPRFRVAVLFLFPVLVWLISAPIVSAIESQLSLFLRHQVAVVVTFVFEMLGYPIEQQGNVLLLPNGGRVGVEDACSGIRSLTACLFAGSFLSAVFFDRFWKKFVLVAASMLFAFVTNIGRGLFLTGWANTYGADAISGTVHDVAGYAVLGVTCAGLLLLVPLLNLQFEREVRTEATDAGSRPG